MSALNLLSVLVLNDLKEMGIKHKEKKNKVIKVCFYKLNVNI